MNWLMIAVVGGAAAWFEYNYRRSQRQQKKAAAGAPNSAAGKTANSSAADAKLSDPPVPETAHVAEIGSAPSIAPGDENDKKLNSPDNSSAERKAYFTRLA